MADHQILNRHFAENKCDKWLRNMGEGGNTVVSWEMSTDCTLAFMGTGLSIERERGGVTLLVPLKLSATCTSYGRGVKSSS